MAALSITAAWTEAAAFVKHEARLLFPIAFMLVALPSGILQLIMPPAVPGQTPSAGAWLLFLPVAAVLGMIGTLALTHLALRPGASVGEALQLGARRFIILLAASLLVFVGFAIAAFPVLLLVGGVAVFAGGGAEPSPGLVLLLALLIGGAAVALWVRLLLISPVVAAEGTGPVAVIRRSWELTRGYFWRLLAFVLLVLLVFAVVTLVAGAIGGILIILVAGQPEPGSLASLLVILIGVTVNMVITVYVAAMHARIYRQLAGGAPTDVFD